MNIFAHSILELGQLSLKLSNEFHERLTVLPDRLVHGQLGVNSWLVFFYLLHDQIEAFLGVNSFWSQLVCYQPSLRSNLERLV